jgi:exopolysaccharide production protein ExoQ
MMSTAVQLRISTPTRRTTPASVWKYDQWLFRRARTWWTLLALFLLAQANGMFTISVSPGRNLRHVTQYYTPSTFLLFMTVFLWLIAAGLIGTAIRPTLRTMAKQKPVLAFATCAFASTVWSQDPLLTFRKAILLSLIFCFACYFASYYRPTEQVRILTTLGLFMAVGSIVTAVALPRFGIDWQGAWKGIFGQKNELGYAMVFLFSGIPFFRIETIRRLFGSTLIAILSLGLIMLSRSRESLIYALLIVGVRIVGVAVVRMNRTKIPFVLYCVLSTAIGVVLLRGPILALLGRDSTLTGRTDEWAILWPYALRHPWLGYGYQAFWTGTGESLSAMTRIGAAVRGPDSGYLDILFQFGLLGFVMVLIALIVSSREVTAIWRTKCIPLVTFWYVALLVVTFVGSFIGTVFLYPTGLGSFAFALACTGLARVKLEAERHKPELCEVRNAAGE